MLYQLKKGEMKPVETIDPEDAGSVVSVLSLEEAPGVLSKYISAGTLTRIFENTSMRYESYEDFDLLCVCLLYTSSHNTKRLTPNKKPVKSFTVFPVFSLQPLNSV